MEKVSKCLEGSGNLIAELYQFMGTVTPRNKDDEKLMIKLMDRACSQMKEIEKAQDPLEDEIKYFSSDDDMTPHEIVDISVDLDCTLHAAYNKYIEGLK